MMLAKKALAFKPPMRECICLGYLKVKTDFRWGEAMQEVVPIPRACLHQTTAARNGIA